MIKLSTKSVHAAVEPGFNKTHVRKEARYVWLVPIRASIGPLEYTCSSNPFAMLSHDLEIGPELPMEVPMSNKLDSGPPPIPLLESFVKIQSLLNATPRTRRTVKEHIPWTT